MKKLRQLLFPSYTYSVTLTYGFSVSMRIKDGFYTFSDGASTYRRADIEEGRYQISNRRFPGAKKLTYDNGDYMTENGTMLWYCNTALVILFKRKPKYIYYKQEGTI